MLIGSSAVQAGATRVEIGDRGRSTGREFVPLVVPQEHGRLQRRTVGTNLGEDGAVVGRLEARRGDHGAASRVLERIGELMAAVRRVDVDEDHADLGGGVLHERPLGIARAPDPDAIAGLMTRREQTAGERRHPVGELAIGPPDPLMAGHERFAVAVLRDGPGEVLSDRLVEQRFRRRAALDRKCPHGQSLARPPSTECRGRGPRTPRCVNLNIRGDGRPIRPDGSARRGGRRG